MEEEKEIFGDQPLFDKCKWEKMGEVREAVKNVEVHQ